MIKNILYSLNKNLGVLLFKNPNTLYYNFFNLFFKKNIVNKFNNDVVINFKEKGFIIPKVNLKDFCLNLQNEIDKQSLKRNSDRCLYFEINENMKDKIKKKIRFDYKKTLKRIEKYYNGKVFVGDVRISRNYDLDHLNERDKYKEVYSNYFHVDHYTYNYFKLFININKIDEDNGPLHYYNIKDSKLLIAKSKYKSRNDYKDIEIKGINKNLGDRGKSLIVNTTECIHRAGVPKYGCYRDVLFITFIVTPNNLFKTDDYFYFEKEYYNSIWNREGHITKKFAKPKSLKDTIKLYNQFKRNKTS